MRETSWDEHVGLCRKLAVACLIALLASPLLAGSSGAASLGEQRRDAERRLEGVDGQIDSANDELGAIERRHARTSDDLAAVEARIAKIEARIAELEAQLEEARAALAAAQEALAETEADVDRTEGELDDARASLVAQREVFGQRVRGAYKRHNVGMAVAVLDAQNVAQATRAAHFVQAFMARDVAQIESIVALEARVERTLAQLAALRERRDAERQAAEAERDRIAGMVDEQEQLQAQADAEADEHRTLLARLEEEGKRYERLVSSLETESAKIERQLANIAAEERRRAEAEERRRREAEERRRQVAASRSGGGGSGGSSAASASTAQSSQLAMPVQGRRTSPFGYRTHPITGVRRLHAGVDWAAPTGTPIRAAESGTVVTAGGMGGYGVTVVVNHGGGMSTLYAHQSRLAVSRGQRVSRGQVIGYVGSTGMSTGPHLHFEVRINGSPVNPLPYL